MSSFNFLHLETIRWAEARQIIPNSTPQAQLLKTMEELGELVGAVVRGNRAGAIDGCWRLTAPANMPRLW
jgi:hypothetical protein